MAAPESAGYSRAASACWNKGSCHGLQRFRARNGVYPARVIRAELHRDVVNNPILRSPVETVGAFPEPGRFEDLTQLGGDGFRNVAVLSHPLRPCLRHPPSRRFTCTRSHRRQPTGGSIALACALAGLLLLS